ncbi:hypothetical protein Franean1_2171 [Parafrankia sp. EAN1pec]|nr:hypothetical protein Franean1_2171 [Frankia sp. EAN1pec]
MTSSHRSGLLLHPGFPRHRAAPRTNMRNTGFLLRISGGAACAVCAGFCVTTAVWGLGRRIWTLRCLRKKISPNLGAAIWVTCCGRTGKIRVAGGGLVAVAVAVG